MGFISGHRNPVGEISLSNCLQREVPEWLHVNFFSVHIVELIDSGTQKRLPVYVDGVSTDWENIA